RTPPQYFGFAQADQDVALFAFVGRITKQKGVHLILDCAEQLIHAFGGRVQFLVGGMASQTEDYGVDCAKKMLWLRTQFPACFWGDPTSFFMDGPLVNLGADFGLMPSLFEPGGIVQQEFFISGAPPRAQAAAAAAAAAADAALAQAPPWSPSAPGG
ncbi:MAG: hypothetical protein ACK4YT_14115, partial [Sphingomonas sp.]